jgi:hypothetical protein
MQPPRPELARYHEAIRAEVVRRPDVTRRCLARRAGQGAMTRMRLIFVD